MSIHFTSISRNGVSTTTFEAHILEERTVQLMEQGIAIDKTSQSEFFHLLKDMPCPFKRQASRSISLFCLAIREGYAPIVQGLIEFARTEGFLDEEITEVDHPDKPNALHIACEQRNYEEGNLAIVSMLLEAGASPVALNAASVSPVHVATCYGKTKILGTMIQYVQKNYSQETVSTVLDLPNGFFPHDTALHMACSKKVEIPQTVSVLLEAGASPFVLNSQRLSPLYGAVYRGNEKTVEIILRHAQKNGYLKELLEQKNGLQQEVQVTAREGAKGRNFEKIANMLLQAEYHIQNPIIFPLFPEKPPSFPDLDRNDVFYSFNYPTGAVGNPVSFR